MVIVTHNKSVDQHPEDKVIMNSYYQYDNSLAD